MEINANSSVGSAARQEHNADQITEVVNKEKPNTAQEKAPSALSSTDVNISSTGKNLSVRAEASEESNTENNSEKNQEANKTADATRIQNNQASEKSFSLEKQIKKSNEAAQSTPVDFYETQANTSASTVEALLV